MFAAKALMGLLMPAITTMVMTALGNVGITGTMTISGVVSSLLTGLVVYLVPNAKKSV